ncbi:hypothetical protein TRVL_02320 [Trypanosoma vivax]|nr:hypothetical protein TRVL_02320 [Trypanosoma vivax]
MFRSRSLHAIARPSCVLRSPRHIMEPSTVFMDRHLANLVMEFEKTAAHPTRVTASGAITAIAVGLLAVTFGYNVGNPVLGAYRKSRSSCRENSDSAEVTHQEPGK